jgi:hypothetical protein
VKPNTTAVLAAALVLLFAAVIAGAFVTRDHELARQLAQGLLNIVIGVAGFYFGSSSGSRAKDDAIAKALAPTPPADPQPGEPE